MATPGFTLARNSPNSAEKYHKNFAGYFHEKGCGLVALEALRMKEQVLHQPPSLWLFTFSSVCRETS